MSRPVVLVTSATGRIGKEVVARLCKSGKVTVRAASHTVATEEEYLKKLGAHQVVNFDLTNKDTWETALKDVEAVYSASPDPLLEHHISFSGKPSLNKRLKFWQRPEGGSKFHGCLLLCRLSVPREKRGLGGAKLNG